MFSQNAKRLYLDYAASTPVAHEVLDAMQPFWREHFSHASSTHTEGRRAHEATAHARDAIARYLQVRSSELLFTSGSTESNALAIRGVVEAYEHERGTVQGLECITTAIEHASVRAAHDWMEEKGMRVRTVAIDTDGLVNLTHFETLLSAQTLLVSIGYVNAEIGVIQPLHTIAHIIKKNFRSKDLGLRTYDWNNGMPVFHTDATQALLTLSCQPQSLGVDLMSIDAHKVYGPKGIGALYVRHGVELAPLFFGGMSHKEMRGGTPPTPLIVGFQKAVEIIGERQARDVEHMQKIQEYFFMRLSEVFPDSCINGSEEERVVNNISVSFPDADHSLLHIHLDAKGVACSTASACLSQGGEGSYVIGALTKNKHTEALRFSLGRDTQKEDVDYVIDTLTRLYVQQS